MNLKKFLEKIYKKLETRSFGKLRTKFEIFRILLSSISILFTFTIGTVNADSSYRIKIDEVVGKRNIVITHPVSDEKYLLYVKTGCGTFIEDQKIELIIDDALNGNGDIIKVDSIHKCTIEQADVVTNKINILDVFGENTKAYIEDENGKIFYISYGSRCSAIFGYKGSYVFTFQQGYNISRSDKIVLPNNDGQCSIFYLKEAEDYTIKRINEQDARPSNVVGISAYPGNGKVYLKWRAAQDDKGIDHYLVSYSKYPLSTKNVLPDDMPNKIIAKKTSYTVSNLENDQLYYFYILAVDTAGNYSSDWSAEATATPKSSILTGNQSQNHESMDIEVASESAISFLINWTPITGARQTVILLNDGVREFTLKEYTKSYIRISKNDNRKGKKLTVRVRAYDIYGSLREEYINFDF